ncbi:hypothetical protein K502DRAFT_274434, partial [Neoconidiobolus thromboides FSU 785]
KSRSAPARSPAQTQSRSASTYAAPSSMARAPAPPAPMHAPAAAAPKQPGLFAQMATTAAGVAVGSAVGHTLANGVSSLFGSSESAQPAQAAQPQHSYYAASEQHGSGSCQADAKAFTNCLESNNNDISACQFYLDMLKQCQSFAAS